MRMGRGRDPFVLLPDPGAAMHPFVGNSANCSCNVAAR
jgi:hypothetical protein